MAVQVLVDSTAGVGARLAERWGLGIVPLSLTWGGATYRDGVDLLPSEFYERLEHEDRNPVTSAPNPAALEAACRQALADGAEHVLVVTASKELSATHANACLAADAVGPHLVSVVDSGQGAGAQALIAANAARTARSGASPSAVRASAEEARDSTELLMAVDTLRYLRRSGRISGPQASIGDLVRLKPILTFADGRLRVIEKPRTMRRALQRLVQRVAAEPAIAHALVMYADDASLGEELADALRPHLARTELDLAPVSSVIGGHAGPGLVGVAFRRAA